MVTKSKKQPAAEKRRKVKVGALKLNKETVKELTDGETRGVKGGLIIRRRGDSVALCDITEQGCVSLGCMTRISSVGNGCCGDLKRI